MMRTQYAPSVSMLDLTSPLAPREAGGRPAALNAYDNGTIEPFNGRAGHILTDFGRWQSTDASYEIIYQDEFEPWCILARCVRLHKGC